jgi:hypothetical protein
MGLFIVNKNGNGQLSWVRMLVAVVLLLLLFMGSYVTAGDEALELLHESVTQPIESVLGGLIAGETLASR